LRVKISLPRDVEDEVKAAIKSHMETEAGRPRPEHAPWYNVREVTEFILGEVLPAFDKVRRVLAAHGVDKPTIAQYAAVGKKLFGSDAGSEEPSE
jgi:hypothetical protein